MKNRTNYPSDVSDQEWEIILPYLLLMKEDAPQRDHSLREVFNGLLWMIRAGSTWRLMPHDLPPWYTVYQQTRRWFNAGAFEAMVHDFRTVLRVAEGRNEEPSAAIFDSRTLQSTPESGGRAGYDGGKKKRGSKVHMAVDTLGFFWPCWLPLQTSRREPRPMNWQSGFRKRRKTPLKSLSSIRATPARLGIW